MSTTGEQCGLRLAGVAMEAGSAPASLDEVAGLLREWNAAGAGVLVRAGGTRLATGNAPARPCRVLDLRQLRGVRQLEREDGVVLVAAGTPLAELRAECEAQGWTIPLPVANDRTTVGGAIATAVLAARSLGFGLVRDAVLGLEVVLADGTRTRCGGRVVKNVTGYDLAKLYTGSFGTLGVIASAWLRLRARPEQAQAWKAPIADADAGCAFDRVLVAARRETASAAVLELERGGARIVCEFAGEGASVEADAAWFRRHFDAAEAFEADRAVLDRAMPGADAAGVAAASHARVRLTGAASRLGQALASLQQSSPGARVSAHPGIGVAFACAADAKPLVEAAERLRAERGLGMLIEAAPDEVMASRDAFALSEAELALTRALKQRFDPAGTLNPGRFAGRS